MPENFTEVGSLPFKITQSESDDRDPHWSQFGIAYTSNTSGNKEIWMIDNANLEGGDSNPRLLTNNAAEDKEPCWSPFAVAQEALFVLESAC